MIAITGGGTGGHLAIAKTLAIELHNRGFQTVFIGSSRGQDKMWFENDNIFKFKYFLSSSGVVNKKGISKLTSLLNILKLSIKCGQIFKKHNINLVISVGGYSSAPASFAALFFRKKFFIHEQNAICGRLNQILKPFCTKFFSSYGNNPYDYPVDKKFFAVSRVRNDLKTVIFLGGSGGASFINSLALSLAPRLDQKNINIIHQCGEKDFDSLQKSYENLGIKVELFKFSPNIECFMSKADICVSRAGASTLWELAANALPSIFIPFPYAAKNHQFFNAKFLQDKKLATICEQKDANSEHILNIIFQTDINFISNSLKNTILEGGAEKIIAEVLQFNIKN